MCFILLLGVKGEVVQNGYVFWQNPGGRQEAVYDGKKLVLYYLALFFSYLDVVKLPELGLVDSHV